MKRDYKVFETREDWINARKNSIGASSLAKFWVTGERETPLPTNIPALNSALKFGSDWEPFIAQTIAKKTGLRLVELNTPIEELEPCDFAWYDNSFYESTESFGKGIKSLHVSLDAAYRDDKGKLVTVEIKTGSAGRYGFISDEFHERYEIQAGIEARMVDADKAVIVYAPRPVGWEKMSPDNIAEFIEKNINDPIEVKFKRPVSKTKLVQKLKEYSSERKQSDPEGVTLLETYLDSKESADLAKKNLEDWLAVHKDEVIYGGGHIAKLTTKESKTTNYKQLFAAKGITPDDVAPFISTKESIRLSLVKDKEAE